MRMTSRERVLSVIERKPVDRLPVDLWYTPEIADMLCAHFGAKDAPELWNAMGIDKLAWAVPTYTGWADDGVIRSIWGTPLHNAEAGDAHYQEFGAAPLADYNTPESLEDYPFWPDPDKFDYETCAAWARDVARDYVVMGPWVSFFEVYCQMRGLEQSMVDLLVEPDLANAILDKIELCQTEMMKRLYAKAGDGVDLSFFSDDMGSQASMMISLNVWDTFFKDRLKRWCDLLHSLGKKVFYHSDGAMEPLVPRLIEAGVDILNPIQHVCPGMDRTELKAKYGEKLIFHGGVENQSILPFGTAQEVREETLKCLETLGKGNEGYVCCSCHNIQPGTPIENILAMVEAVKG